MVVILLSRMVARATISICTPQMHIISDKVRFDKGKRNERYSFTSG